MVNRSGIYLRILSHNVGQDFSCGRSLNILISNSRADIVLLQELPTTIIEGYLPATAQIYPHQHYGQPQSAKYINIGILSRYPIVSKENFKLAEYGLVYQQRAVMDIYGKNIALYNIHLTYPRIDVMHDPFFSHFPWPRYNYSVRCEEVRNLVILIQAEQYPIMAGGDFNFTARSDDYKQLVKLLIDAYSIAGSGTRWSWPIRRVSSMRFLPAIPFVRIDYLFHSPSFQPYTARFLEKTDSDHLPLLTSVFLEN